MTKQNFHFRCVKVKRLVEETSLLLPPPGSSILVQTTLCHPAACKTILGRGDLLFLLVVEDVGSRDDLV